MVKPWGLARRGLCLLGCVSLVGCATPAFEEARGEYYAGDPVAGVAILDQAAAADAIPARDTLLLHLERGLLLHRAGLYEPSAQAFVEAAAYLDEQDTLRLSEQARSLLSNDWSKAYLGEYSERLWSHSFAMMSFLMAQQAEGAAVEARQALQVLEAHEEALQGAVFSRALIALSFELAGQHNDAYVAYRALHEQLPDNPAFALATYRTAVRVASDDGATTWRAQVSEPLWQQHETATGEAILFVTQGRGPRKFSSSLVGLDERLAFPAYTSDSQTLPSPTLGHTGEHNLIWEQVSTDTLVVAESALGARGKQVLAKALLRASIKHNAVKQLREKDQVAGDVLGLVLFVLEEADTRGWESLPARWSLLRVPLQEGQTEIQVQVGLRQQTVTVDPTAQGLSQVFSLHF